MPGAACHAWATSVLYPSRRSALLRCTCCRTAMRRQRTLPARSRPCCAGAGMPLQSTCGHVGMHACPSPWAVPCLPRLGCAACRLSRAAPLATAAQLPQVCPPPCSGEHPEEQIAVLLRTHAMARLMEQELVSARSDWNAFHGTVIEMMVREMSARPPCTRAALEVWRSSSAGRFREAPRVAPRVK